MNRFTVFSSGLIACALLTSSAEASETAKPATAVTAGEDGDVSVTPEVATHHIGVFHGQKIRYTARLGRVPSIGPDGSVDTQMFYVAYTKDRAAPESRPIIFFTNGGPGSATAWMHIGGLGPRKIVLNPDGSTPPSPVHLMDNHNSPLDRADLVFVDAPGTGFSRIASEAAKNRVLTKDGDLATYATFIQNYLRQNHRFGSALYLMGESFGGFRVAGLSDVLVRRGVPLKGVILLSSAVNFTTLDPDMANDLPYVLALPSYASVQAFHHKLDPSLTDSDAMRNEVEQWALTVYQPALSKGTTLPPEERSRVLASLSHYTGISAKILDMLNLRLSVENFMKYANVSDGTTGRVDGRMTGPAPAGRVEEPFYDPAMGSLTPAFTAATSEYLFDELKTNITLPYRMYSRDVAERFEIMPAIKGYATDGYPSTLDGLQSTIVKNKDFRVLSISGAYDLACPYFTLTYTLDHMALPPEYQQNVQRVLVQGGHMAYADSTGLVQMNDAIAKFLDGGNAATVRSTR